MLGQHQQEGVVTNCWESQTNGNEMMTTPPTYLFLKSQITFIFPTGSIMRPHVARVISGGVTTNTSHSWTYIYWYPHLQPPPPSPPPFHLHLLPGASLLFWFVAEFCSAESLEPWDLPHTDFYITMLSDSTVVQASCHTNKLYSNFEKEKVIFLKKTIN